MEVFKTLRNIDAATGSQETQTELTDKANTIVQDICDDHIAAADAFVHDEKLKGALKQDVELECRELIEYIQASRRFKLEINSRSKDRVVSFGERLSCRFMTYVLKDRVRPRRPSLAALPQLTCAPACASRICRSDRLVAL